MVTSYGCQQKWQLLNSRVLIYIFERGYKNPLTVTNTGLTLVNINRKSIENYCW